MHDDDAGSLRGVKVRPQHNWSETAAKRDSNRRQRPPRESTAAGIADGANDSATMPPKRRSSPTNAPSAKKPRAKANDTEEAYVEGDAWLLPALHKHGGEDFAAVANDPAFDGPRRGRTAEELEVALTQWMSRPMSKPSPRKGSPRARTAKKDDNFVALEDSSDEEEPVAKKPKSTPVCSVCKKQVPTEKCAICSKRFSMKCAGRERVPDAGVFECDSCEAKNLCHETCGGGKSGNKQADYRCGHCGRRYCEQALRENGQRAPQGDLWRCFRCEASYGLEAIECHDGDWYLCTWKASADWSVTQCELDAIASMASS